jgi:hypothetical protein
MKMHEEKPAYNEMFLMYRDGMTCQQIADEFHVARQWVNYILTRYYGTKGMRGRGFDIQTIVYKGIYEHFKNNQYESLTSFTDKVYEKGHNKVRFIADFITGKSNSHLSIPQIQRMCEITGTTFEECFERRDIK